MWMYVLVFPAAPHFGGTQLPHANSDNSPYPPLATTQA